jgi:phosphotransferase system enzyme I (PtsI)
LDLGGEKLPLSVPVPSGANPSLSVRAIRFSARRPDIFRTQLRALYRASAVGPMRIMFPMISGVAEMHEARTIAKEVRAELERERVPYDPGVPLGAMIETPSAALTADHLTDVCDFFSIGTNDLIQYTFAADRENEDVQYLYHPLHPAILRLLKQVIDAANAAGKPVSLCGDLGGDPSLTWMLLGLGLRELSMLPRRIPAVKAVIAGTRLSEAQDLAAKALLLRSDREVEELVAAAMRGRFPLEIGAAEENAAEAPEASKTEARR